MNPGMTLEGILDFFNSRGSSLDRVEKDKIEISNSGRETLAQLFKFLNYKEGAEIGVEQGIYSETLLKENPDLHLFAIDAWTAYKGYRDHVSQEKMDKLLEDTTARLAPYNATIIKDFSVFAARKFADESLDFVYIDGNHEYQQVVNDIATWIKKVKVGGIISGHDYIKRTNKQRNYLMHVPMALHGYLESYEIKPLFILGRKAEIEGELRDSPRSWFFVKPEPPQIAIHDDSSC